MNRLLIDKDYLRLIQPADLIQITQGDSNILLESEQVAQAEISSYIAKRYDTSQIFTNTSLYNSGTTYFADNLVYVSAPYFINSTGQTYNPGDRVVFSATNGTDYIYYNISPVTGATNTYNSTYFSGGTLEDNSLFYVTLPAPYYEVDGDYIVGSTILFKDFTYESLKVNNNRWLMEDWELEVTSETGSAVIPGYSKNWQTFWSASTSKYSITGIQPDLDTTGVWTRGDNRNQIVLQYMLDIILYHMHARTNARLIPELRMIRYDGNNPAQNGGAIGWLKKINSGTLQLDEQEIIPTQGQSIYWTSEVKRRLNY